MLEIPRTIRDVTEEDVGNNISVLESVRAKQSAKIVEGYKLLPKTDASEMEFDFYAEINVNNSRLFDLFVSLCNELPDTVALLFGLYDEDVNYGIYTSKDDILNELKKYKKEIKEDCSLELGLIYHTESDFIEVFIPEAKYIKFWGIEENSFRNIMDAFDLKEINNIEFIDEYPKAVRPLKMIDEGVTDTDAIIAALQAKFIQ